MRQGIINLLKPAGMTSHDCVYHLRKITGIKRIGHTGTLDPFAIGVLPLCIGKSTRIIDYLDMDKKEYRCEMILGITTDTQDIWGNVLTDKRATMRMPTPSSLSKAFSALNGEIMQSLPMYSSAKISGKRLYEYAREGKVIETGKKPVTIYHLEFIGFNSMTGRVVFDVTCSRGTYVRSICHEVGESLGCGGAMSFLLRTGSGSFNLSDTVTLENLTESWEEHLLPTDFPLGSLGAIRTDEAGAKKFVNGNALKTSEAVLLRHPKKYDNVQHIKHREGLEFAYCVYKEDVFLGVAVYIEYEKKFKADKVFYG